MVGTTNVDVGGKIYEIKNWTIHEKYYDPHIWDHDFGLILIKGSIEFTSTVKPIELPKSDFIKAGDKVVIMGFGNYRVSFIELIILFLNKKNSNPYNNLRFS